MDPEYEKQMIEQNIQKAFSAVPQWIKDDVFHAANWAKKTLTNHEGAGHTIEVVAAPELNKLCCTFSKADWDAPHCGRGMRNGSEAIIMSVCEYMHA